MYGIIPQNEKGSELNFYVSFVRSKAVVDVLLIDAPIICGDSVFGPWLDITLCLSSFAIILLGKREVIALLYCHPDALRQYVFCGSVTDPSCKLGNFRRVLFLRNFAYAKFREKNPREMSKSLCRLLI